MAARDKERYFWLKLHRDFFKRHDIRILEGMANGKEYVLLYLKLMVEAIDHEGALRFSEEIPYTEEMLASITNTEADVVHDALQVFIQLGLMDCGEDKTLFFPAVAKLLDSETCQTKRKREAAKTASLLPEVKNTPGGVKSTREIETEIETESEKDIDTETEELTALGDAVCRTQDIRRVMDAWNSLGLQQLVRLDAASRRGSMLRSRISEYGLDAVLEAIEKIRSSAFLKGQNAKSWVITFDWFVKPGNFPKVLEGNYDDRGECGKPKTSNPFLEMMMEEADG